MLKKPIVWGLSLLLVVFTGDRLIGYFLKKSVDHSLFRYSRMYGGKADAPILLVGNSRGLIFYQPAISALTGQPTFNLSYNGLPAPLAASLLSDYLDAYPKKKKIFIDITLCDRPNRELVSGFSVYAPYSNRLSALLKKDAPETWWGSHLSQLYRYNNEIFQRALFYQNRSDEDWLIDRQITPALAATLPLDTFPISVQPALVAALGNAIREATALGHKVHLVIGPYYPGMVRDWSNLQELKLAIENYTGLPVHDFSQALSDTTDFGDLMHPNKKGAAHFVELLGGLLSN